MTAWTQVSQLWRQARLKIHRSNSVLQVSLTRQFIRSLSPYSDQSFESIDSLNGSHPRIGQKPRLMVLDLALPFR